MRTPPGSRYSIRSGSCWEFSAIPPHRAGSAWQPWPRDRDPGAARTPQRRAPAPPEVTRGGRRGLESLRSAPPPEGPCSGVYTRHTRRTPGPPLRYRRERGRSLQPSEPPVRGRAPETLAGGAEGTVAAPGLTPPPAARYSPRRRQRKIPAFWDSGCGIFPPSRHSPGPAARAAADGTAAGNAAPSAVVAAGSPRPRALAQCRRRSLDSRERARRGDETEAPPPRGAGDVTTRRWRRGPNVVQFVVEASRVARRPGPPAALFGFPP